MRWRARLFALHRDVGFLALGLTAVYAVSGLAVNHRHHWNYNQSTRTSEVRVGRPAELLSELPAARREALAGDPGAVSPGEEPALVAALTRALGRPRGPRSAFWRGPDRFSLFYETGDRDTVDYAPTTGVARRLSLADRPLLRELNFLHLNERHGAWTWLADGYALLLLFLAGSGVVMVRGRAGLSGRGGLLVAVGIAVPVAAALLLR